MVMAYADIREFIFSNLNIIVHAFNNFLVFASAYFERTLSRFPPQFPLPPPLKPKARFEPLFEVFTCSL
jgi:hypothetical protein